MYYHITNAMQFQGIYKHYMANITKAINNH